MTKVTKTIFNSPEQLNIVCERINSLLSNHKTKLLAICHSFDKSHSGRLSYEQFRLSNNETFFFLLTISIAILFLLLVIRDRLPKISSEDIFILMKLFEIEGLIDYRAILDEKLGNGILRYIKSLPVPPLKEIILEKKSPKQSFNLPLQINNPK